MRRAIDYALIIRAKTFASILLAIITATAHSQQPAFDLRMFDYFPCHYDLISRHVD
jgi:hypothetical protein